MKRRILTRSAVALLLVFGVSSAVRSQSFASAHWKSKMEMEGGRQGSRVPAEYEIWFRGGKMRMKGTSAGQSVNMLKIGDDLYIWSDGQPIGMKMNAAMSQRQNRPSQDYVGRVEEIKAKGKKAGSETVDGHACDIYEYQEEGKRTKGMYWLAKDLQYFPIKAVLDLGDGTKTTYHNTDILIPASISDSAMELPKDVQFQDLSQMMKGMQGKEN